jgi:hypothetical protein
MPRPRKRNDSGHKQPNAPAPRRASSAPSPAAPELIDPRWLLRALGIVFAVALLLAYATLCLLYYQGQWQIVLHPSRTVSATPASLGLPFSDLHFGVDATGTPQLTGWYIPADNATGADTALMLHGADVSMADALPRALTLHSAGLNVLLFDYGGYGKSAGQHPTQNSMQADAASALNFLVNTQHISPQHIVLYGQGVGASLAAQLAAQHHDFAALILDEPDGDLYLRAAHDPRSRLVPARVLFNETFPLRLPLLSISTPRLLINYSTNSPALHSIPAPTMIVELPTHNDPALVSSIRRFLDTYVTQSGH